MTATKFCYACEEDRPFRVETRPASLEVRGETVEVDVTYFVCETCGSEFADEAVGDPVELAFNAYRERHGLLVPEQIKGIREEWSLSQASLAALLGMSQATINRYENGSLQEQTHDELIRACSDRSHMEDLLHRRGHVLSDLQRRKLEAALKPGSHLSRQRGNTAFDWLDDIVGEAMESTGFREFDLRRFEAILLRLIRSATCVTRTKLNKLLFYTDFLYFRSHAISMTGLPYERLPYGPVSPAADPLLSLLEHRGVIRREVRVYENRHEGTEIFPADPAPDDPVALSDDEQAVLDYVGQTFGNMTPSRISDVSHKETAWLETPDREFISYQHAERLNYGI